MIRMQIFHVILFFPFLRILHNRKLYTPHHQSPSLLVLPSTSPSTTSILINHCRCRCADHASYTEEEAREDYLI